MRRVTIVCPAGGIGGARFISGLLRHLARANRQDEVIVIANTADDIRILGLQVCPDLDTLMYTLGGGISKERGWGREGETWQVKDELQSYEFGPTWFGLGDRDLATHLVRTSMLDAGFTLTEVTHALCQRWNPGVTLLPMSDDRVETHVVVEDDQGRRAIHFQEWWIRHRAALPALSFPIIGIETSRPTAQVLTAIAEANVILLPPSNPVVSIGTIMSVPGMREALASATAPVVGVSPIIGGKPVRGMADACLSAIDVATTAAGVAEHYGPRTAGGLLDAWLIDETDAAAQAEITALGIRTVVQPTLMIDDDAAANLAAAALDTAESLR
jgi:LPPG:FO 2-phospho-L-lactate transferase